MSIFKGGSSGPSVQYCANCRTYMSVRYIVEIDDKEFKVCSYNCEKELRAKHEASNQITNQTTNS